MIRERGSKLYVGYAFGNGSEACIYNFVASFFMIYLTGVAGINAQLAGTITSIALLIETVASIVIGKISDRTSCRYGRRRPYILVAAILAPISIFAMFYNVQFPLLLKVVYYITAGMAFWIIYAVFYIPYTALGAEIAKGYDDRTKLRSLARGFGLVGTLLGFTLPLLLLQFFQEQGFNKSFAWHMVALTIGIVCFTGYFFCWNLTRNGEIQPINIEKNITQNSIITMFYEFLELLKLKPMKIALIYKVFFTCAFTFFSTSMIFFLQYNLQLKNDKTSTIYVISVAFSLALTPFITKMAIKLGKKKQQTIAMLFSGACGIVIYFLGICNYYITIIYVMIFSFAQTSFWQLSNAIFYDIIEIDEFVYDKRREGDISCIQSVVGTLVTAATVQTVGMLIEIAQLDLNGSNQAPLAVKPLSLIFILLPSINLVFAGIIISIFPITRTRFEVLLKTLILKKEGKNYQCYIKEIDKMIR